MNTNRRDALFAFTLPASGSVALFSMPKSPLEYCSGLSLANRSPAATFGALKLGIAQLPRGVGWGSLLVTSV
jgi:hypothetical protein